jgi:hypothetical protein
MIGSRKEKKTNVYAVRLAGWLMKKEEKKKNREVMIHKRFFLVCVCVGSLAQKMLCARIERKEKNANVPLSFCLQIPPVQTSKPTKEKEYNRGCKRKKRQKGDMRQIPSPLKPLCQKRKALKVQKKE